MVREFGGGSGVWEPSGHLRFTQTDADNLAKDLKDKNHVVFQEHGKRTYCGGKVVESS